MQREDPLATQVWKMYARTKATLPHAQRMENLTWRMMALALRKKREEEAKKEAESQNPQQPMNPSSDDPQRGRQIAKGKSKTRVEGFDDGKQDDE